MNAAPPRPHLVISGAEGVQGRAMLLLSALHHCAEALAGWDMRVVGAIDPAVLAALEALHWDTGLRPQLCAGPDAAALALPGARLFAAVSFSETSHLPLALVRQHGVPAVVAVQFPDPWRHGAAELALERAAHDPVALAQVLLRRAGAA